MPDTDTFAGQGGNNNSSDFVRKLYKMLEDPNHNEVVRWGDHNDSFVVLENEKFTKLILPKHFKHSNFASFVRQLNKYDFHKVRQNDENGTSPYGPSAWEFKHPEFHRDAKNNLDNIRRKAPAARKPPASDEQYSPNASQLTALTDTLAATQQQVQALQDSYFESRNMNKLFADELLRLQRHMKAQFQVNKDLVTMISKLSLERRQDQSSGNHVAGYGASNLIPDGSEESPHELQRAREILNGLSSDQFAEADLQQLSLHLQQVGASPESAGSGTIMGPPGSAGLSQYIHDPMAEMRQMVYPVGQNIGIDPFAQEHMGNIPYNRPLPSASIAPVPEGAGVSMTTPAGSSAAGSSGSPWGMKKPRILLVEDDKTCSRIGSKFLAQYDCGVEVARDGLEAVNKVNSNSSWFDLIFMDIVMPQLDGISATAMIRDVAPRVPIIAMTSNINQQDIEMYFQYGMKDVLAKPFTKDGMIHKLKKHLPQMLRNPPAEALMETIYVNGNNSQQPPTPGPYPNATMSLPAVSTAASVPKFETTPIQSPAAATPWQSPGQGQHPSPNISQDQGYLGAGSRSQLAGTSGPPQPQQYGNTMITNIVGATGRMPDGLPTNEGPPEKRQRVYGPQGTYA